MVCRFCSFGARHLRLNQLLLLIGGIVLVVLYILHYSYPDEAEYCQYFISHSKYDIAVEDIPYVIENNKKCRNAGGDLENVRLLLVVKSAVDHADRRSAIRLTWGWEFRFPDVVIRLIFNLGLKNNTQHLIEKEQLTHGDIIQGSFNDTYYNNTLKTMLGFRWVVEHCPTAQFVMFVDDDEYVSIRNVLHFISNPHEYPSNVQNKPRTTPDEKGQSRILEGNHSMMNLYVGYVFDALNAQRDTTSKWYITKAEYPFKPYPPFVAADSIIVSSATLHKLYYLSAFVKRIKFDDVYLGIVAKIAGITPVNNIYFQNKKKPFSLQDYRFVISSHGYGNPDELINVWSTQYRLGFA